MSYQYNCVISSGFAIRFTDDVLIPRNCAIDASVSPNFRTISLALRWPQSTPFLTPCQGLRHFIISLCTNVIYCPELLHFLFRLVVFYIIRIEEAEHTQLAEDKKEDYQLFVTIETGKIRQEKVRCKVYLPERLTDPIALHFFPTEDQVPYLRNAFEFSIQGEIENLSGVVETRIQAQKVYSIKLSSTALGT